ncbi:hypothetical protein FA15DRAFT_669124 [Coprinopsis marcescibilis]|uniref:F-box domain-containing protein n=1 Tax=Coprinopsis marcescibilis TaxID=230819 RepID=A0A5C3KVY4_COPMA|nr:hypothetical protein FA15DRAFT_669124 [Coprinopsis marcescibilis]
MNLFWSLAPELIQKIGDEARFQDLKRMRLVCKLFSVLFQRKIYHCFDINIGPFGYPSSFENRGIQRRIDKLEALGREEHHPAKIFTKELRISTVWPPTVKPYTTPTDEEVKLFLELLVPALGSLKIISKLEWFNNLTVCDAVYSAVFECIKPMIPNLTSLKLSQIPTKIVGPTSKFNAPILILTDPRLPLLVNLHIDCGGEDPNQTTLLSLLTALSKLLCNSRTTLRSFKCLIPVHILGSRMPTIQSLFNLGTNEYQDAAITDFVTSPEFVRYVRSITPTIPHFKALQSLDLQAFGAYDSELHLPYQRHTFDLWTVMANTGIQLRHIKSDVVTKGLVDYISSYSGGLQELSVKSYGEENAEQPGKDLFTRALNFQHTSLRFLNVDSWDHKWHIFREELATTGVFVGQLTFSSLEELQIPVFIDSTMENISLQVLRGPTDGLPLDTKPNYIWILLGLVTQKERFPSLKKVIITARPPRFDPPEHPQDVELAFFKAATLRLCSYRFNSATPATSCSPIPAVIILFQDQAMRHEYTAVEISPGRWGYSSNSMRTYPDWDPEWEYSACTQAE